MKRIIEIVWDTLREIGEARARQRLGLGSWDY